GRTFPTVRNAWWLGNAGGSYTGVAIFGTPVACTDLSPSSWDTRIPNNTQFIFILTGGQTPGAYPAGPSDTPASGQAFVKYNFSHAGSNPDHWESASGTVTLQTIVGGVDVAGTFTAHYGGSTLSGAFDAAYRATGHQP